MDDRSSQIGSQEKDATPTATWKKPTLFKMKKGSKNDAFDVEMDFSSQESGSQLSQASSTSSQRFGKTLSQDTSNDFRKLQLFKDQGRQLKDAFNVDFEESKQISTPEDTNEGNLSKIKKVNPFQNKNQARYNAFEVDFESSKQILTPEDTNERDFSKMRKPNPFQNKKQPRHNAFEVDFEESKQISTPEDTNEGDLSKIRKPNPFQNKKQPRHNAFEIDFEESKQLSTPEDTNERNLSKISKSNPFQNKKRPRHNAFEIDFEESKQLSTPEDTNEGDLSKIRKPNPFQNQKQTTYNAFEIDFEESKQLSTPEDTNERNLSKISKSNPFDNQKQTRYNSFEIDFEESPTSAVALNNSNLNKTTPFRSSEKNLSVEISGAEFDKSKDTNDMGSVTPARNENSSTAKSSDVSENTRIRCDKSNEESHLRLDVSSFNDENLNNWMSDHSEDEINQNDSLEESTGKKSLPISPPLKNSELHFVSDEELKKQFQEKLNAIIDKASQGKMEKSTFALPKTNNSDKSTKKRSDNKGSKSNGKKNRLAKPAPFANKRLYNYLIKKMEPKYGIDCVLEAEDIVKSICEVVKIVLRRKSYQKKLVNDLKVEMAKHGIIETTNDFYIFVRSFLPYDFREKVIPCLQPITNIVFPPKDSKSPFEKILNN